MRTWLQILKHMHFILKNAHRISSVRTAKLAVWWPISPQHNTNFPHWWQIMHLPDRRSMSSIRPMAKTYHFQNGSNTLTSLPNYEISAGYQIFSNFQTTLSEQWKHLTASVLIACLPCYLQYASNHWIFECLVGYSKISHILHLDIDCNKLYTIHWETKQTSLRNRTLLRFILCHLCFSKRSSPCGGDADLTFYFNYLKG
jgi:hypothetical protein